MNISLAFSPCPNDTFIFDALVHQRVDTNGIAFSANLFDIETLNRMAARGETDMIKISYAAYPAVSEKYQLLTSGGALGRGVGPLVVSRLKIHADELEHTRIAIPGEQTTANLLLSIHSPNALNRAVYPFSQIEDVVMAYEAEVGVIIHENRFTYQQKGLRLVVDLGEFWEQHTGLPIPLGGIAIRRDMPEDIKQAINAMLRSSVEFALTRPSASYPFVSQNAQSLSDEVLRNHIELYVNEYTLDLGEEGKKAVRELFRRAAKTNFAPTINDHLSIFV